jgi:hypothetical protein
MNIETTINRQNSLSLPVEIPKDIQQPQLSSPTQIIDSKLILNNSRVSVDELSNQTNN